MFKSQVQLRVVDGSALIEPLDGSINAASDHLEPDLLSFIDAEDAKQQAKQQHLVTWRFWKRIRVADQNIKIPPWDMQP